MNIELPPNGILACETLHKFSEEVSDAVVNAMVEKGWTLSLITEQWLSPERMDEQRRNLWAAP